MGYMKSRLRSPNCYIRGNVVFLRLFFLAELPRDARFYHIIAHFLIHQTFLFTRQKNYWNYQHSIPEVSIFSYNWFIQIIRPRGEIFQTKKVYHLKLHIFCFFSLWCLVMQQSVLVGIIYSAFSFISHCHTNNKNVTHLKFHIFCFFSL